MFCGFYVGLVGPGEVDACDDFLRSHSLFQRAVEMTCRVPLLMFFFLLVCILSCPSLIFPFPLQRQEKEQRDLVSRWTELGTDEPGNCYFAHFSFLEIHGDQTLFLLEKLANQLLLRGFCCPLICSLEAKRKTHFTLRKRRKNTSQVGSNWVLTQKRSGTCAVGAGQHHVL